MFPKGRHPVLLDARDQLLARLRAGGTHQQTGIFLAVKDRAGFIRVHPDLGVERAVAAGEFADDGQGVAAGAEGVAHMKILEAAREFLAHGDFALARGEPPAGSQLDLGTQGRTHRRHTAHGDIGLALPVDTRLVMSPIRSADTSGWPLASRAICCQYRRISNCVSETMLVDSAVEPLRTIMILRGSPVLPADFSKPMASDCTSTNTATTSPMPMTVASVARQRTNTFR